MNWLRGAGSGHHDRDRDDGHGAGTGAGVRARGDDGAPETPVHRWAIQAFKGAFLPSSASSVKTGFAAPSDCDERNSEREAAAMAAIAAMAATKPTMGMPAASHRLAELRRSTSYPPVQAHGTPTGIMRTPGLGRDTVERKKSVKFSTHLASHAYGATRDGDVGATLVVDGAASTRTSSRSGLPEAFPGKFPSPYTPRFAQDLHSRAVGLEEDGVYAAEAVDSPSNEARDRSRRRSGSIVASRSGPPPRALSLTDFTTTPSGPPPAKGLTMGERSARSVNTRFALTSAAAALDASRSAKASVPAKQATWAGEAEHVAQTATEHVAPALAGTQGAELEWELDGDVETILACVERNNAHLERMIEEMQRLAQSDDFDDALLPQAADAGATAMDSKGDGDGDGDGDTTVQLDQPKSKSGKFWQGRFRQLDGMVAACRAEQDRMHAAVAAIQSGRPAPVTLAASTITAPAGAAQAGALGASTNAAAATATAIEGMAATPGKVKLEARWRERLAKQQREHEAAVQKVRDATAGGRETRELRRQIKLLQESQSQSQPQSQSQSQLQSQARATMQPPPSQPSQAARGRFAAARPNNVRADPLGASTTSAPLATRSLSQSRSQAGVVNNSRFARTTLASSRSTTTAAITTASSSGPGTGTGLGASTSTGTGAGKEAPSRAPMSATSRRIASLSSQSSQGSQESTDLPAGVGTRGQSARRLSRSVSRDSGNGTAGRSFATSTSAGAGSATTTVAATVAATMATMAAGRGTRTSFVLKDADADLAPSSSNGDRPRALRDVPANTLSSARTRQTGAAAAKAELVRTPRPTASRFTTSITKPIAVAVADAGAGTGVDKSLHTAEAAEKGQRMEAARRRLEDRRLRRRQDVAPIPASSTAAVAVVHVQ